MPVFTDPVFVQNFLEFGVSRSPDAAPTGKARLWWDQANSVLKMSVSGGAYAEVANLGTDALTNADLIQAIADGAFAADADTRALFADGIWTAVKLEEQVQRIADVTITSAQVLALNATPITLIAAPGADKALIFEGAVLYKAAGTAYADIAGGDDLAIKYTNGSGLDVAVAEMTGFADQATAQMRFILPQTGALAAGTVSDFTPVANAALVAHMLTGEITTGNSDFKLRIYYRVVPTVL